LNIAMEKSFKELGAGVSNIYYFSTTNGMMG
jgi:hypothetical protein